jgi:hypothetical protein
VSINLSTHARILRINIADPSVDNPWSRGRPLSIPSRRFGGFAGWRLAFVVVFGKRRLRVVTILLTEETTSADAAVIGALLCAILMSVDRLLFAFVLPARAAAGSGTLAQR